MPENKSDIPLSPIRIDKHYRIFLPGCAHAEVKMYPLSKALYLLFLRYPEGIRYKQLYEYRKELLQLYNKVTNRYDKKEIEKAIDELVDVTKPNISIQCSRIRAAFRKVLPEPQARFYYIHGVNGGPKKIALPRCLLQ
jgi:hypothetical protein